MQILIVGGTKFVGRALVEAARARGHEVTLFNRGQTNPALFSDIEHITGDREDSLHLLAGRTWDAAIDTCGYYPRVVRLSAKTLASHVGHYTFISSISVYTDVGRAGIDEEEPAGRIDDETIEEITEETYGPLKALCEKAVAEEMSGRALLIRPGLIVGPHDPTDRFTYWPWRVSQGEEVLAPGRPDRRIQIVDVRDLAEWNIRMVEENATGIFNATGPQDPPLAMGELLETSRRMSDSDASFTWVDEAFLESNGVAEWTEMPLWVAESKAENRGFYEIDCRRAVDRGLKFRPITETIRATLDMIAEKRRDESWLAGISRARETELLAAWKADQEETG